MFKKALLSLFAIYFATTTLAQTREDSLFIAAIFKTALKEGTCYQDLKVLSTQIGGRLSGSPQAAKAVDFMKNLMTDARFDSVYLQEVMVPHWVRGPREKAVLTGSKQGIRQELSICALGGSIATAAEGVEAQVVEVNDFSELDKLGKAGVQGKIVFYNRPMNPELLHTFHAYGTAVNQRSEGAMYAARYGAVACVVRSMTLANDDYPHTGAMRYQDTLPKIPACAVSTMGADALSRIIREDPNAILRISFFCKSLPDTLSHNVIGELKGTESPKNVILVGGHLDSWDNGDGAHDDGAGCMQSVEAIRILKRLGYKPRNTLRAVMFMNEENGLRGGKKYAELAGLNKEYHKAAIESDAGGFTPRGFTMTADDQFKRLVKRYAPLLLPYGLHDFSLNGGGADIGPLYQQYKTPMLGLMPDSQRYFDIHHTAADTFDKINRRELELGAASMAAMLYILDNIELH